MNVLRQRHSSLHGCVRNAIHPSSHFLQMVFLPCIRFILLSSVLVFDRLAASCSCYLSFRCSSTSPSPSRNPPKHEHYDKSLHICGGVLVEMLRTISSAKEARKSPSKLRRKFATNFAENFANFTLEIAGAYRSDTSDISEKSDELMKIKVHLLLSPECLTKVLLSLAILARSKPTRVCTALLE